LGKKKFASELEKVKLEDAASLVVGVFRSVVVSSQYHIIYLYVRVVKAKELPNMDITGSCDPSQRDFGISAIKADTAHSLPLPVPDRGVFNFLIVTLVLIPTYIQRTCAYSI
ncbi:hypothetical protein ACJX0J_028173, partial [Zea mays]